MNSQINKSSRGAWSGQGFTLIEVLMSMFILSIGLIAIASVFPVSAYLQKQTFKAVVSRQVVENVEALLKTKKISIGDLTAGLPMIDGGVYDTDCDVHRLPNLILDENVDLAGIGIEWPLTQRCYPLADFRAGMNNDDPEALNREFYWVPLVRDADLTPNVQAWEIYVFILKNRRNAAYTKLGLGADDEWAIRDIDTRPSAPPGTDAPVPGVKRLFLSSRVSDNVFQIPATDPQTERDLVLYPVLQPGDQVLDNTGKVYQVIDVDGMNITVNGTLPPVFGSNQGDLEAIWYGVPADDDDETAEAVEDWHYWVERGYEF